MTGVPDSAITLRALDGEPMDDPAVRDMVVATARAIAERQGVAVLDLQTDAAGITVTLRAARIAAVGFAAELRRVTERWYTAKFGEATLWGEPGGDGDRPYDPGADE